MRRYLKDNLIEQTFFLLREISIQLFIPAFIFIVAVGKNLRVKEDINFIGDDFIKYSTRYVKYEALGFILFAEIYTSQVFLVIFLQTPFLRFFQKKSREYRCRQFVLCRNFKFFFGDITSLIPNLYNSKIVLKITIKFFIQSLQFVRQIK